MTLNVCPLKFNVDNISSDINLLIAEHNYDLLSRFTANTDKDKSAQVTINLTHPVGIDEKDKYFGPLTTGYKGLKDAGIDSSSFVELGNFFNGTYIEQVVNSVKKYHQLTYPDAPPITRIFCAYLGPGAGFTFHKDAHTLYKYHLPIKTNKWSFMFTEEKGNIQMTHMPADGRVWLLDTQEMHTAFNMAPTKLDYRMHIIFNVFK